jgi:hypothetical protein
MEDIVPARILHLQTIDPGEIRLVQLALPEHVTLAGKSYIIQDTMRPGTAFLAKPWGFRTSKYRRRMYTRSNSSFNEPRLLETIINHTHQDPADTSVWWQSEMAYEWFEKEKTVDVRLRLDPEEGIASVYENTTVYKSTNLRLEDENEWTHMNMVCVAFGTGITPFLSYVRYMTAHYFGQEKVRRGAHLTLVASVRHAGQLMLHEELLSLEKQFPQNFCYQPVLTRSWPERWEYGKGRIVRVVHDGTDNGHIDMTSLRTIVPDLALSHLRLCGSVTACRQVILGLKQEGVVPLTVRAESW